MGLFDNIQKKGAKALQSQPAVIRKQSVKISIDQRPFSTSRPRSPQRDLDPLALASKPLKPTAPISRVKLIRSGSLKRSCSPQTRLESSSDSDETESTANGSQRKRRRISHEPEIDAGRRIRSEAAFLEDDSPEDRIHATVLISGPHAGKYDRAFPSMGGETTISLQYPSASEPERYGLVFSNLSEEFAPLDEMKECISLVIQYYLPPDKVQLYNNEENGILRNLQRALKKQDGVEYRLRIERWNAVMVALRKQGRLQQTMDTWKFLELPLVERILTQTYSRTVSPRAQELRRYENGTDDVYGELLPKFVSDILLRDTKIKSDQIFVDLGSGVGNVVLQAALQIGCESWGCEKMPNACELADLQEKEFRARCRLWGLSHGHVHLERGDFLTNAPIRKALAKADVVLVNNQAFTAGLNEDLTNLFLDLKEGCLIVSLRSFVPSGHKITKRNLNSPCNQLDVKKKEYYSRCVSWTDVPGSYYLSKKDGTRVQQFVESYG